MSRSLIISLVTMAACVHAPAPVAEAPAPAPSVAEAPAAAPAVAAPVPKPVIDVTARLAAMTLEQKVGQLMMVGFGGFEMDGRIESLVKGLRVGGIWT